MEATGIYWKPVWNILSDGDFELVLANAAHIKNVPGRKTDVSDAAWIADLLAHGLIRSSFVPEQEIQELRELLRTRKQLGRQQSNHIKRLQKTLESGQRQARLSHHGRRRQERARDDPGADRGPDRSRQAGGLGGSADQGLAPTIA
jgi:transposase